MLLYFHHNEKLDFLIIVSMETFKNKNGSMRNKFYVMPKKLDARYNAAYKAAENKRIFYCK